MKLTWTAPGDDWLCGQARRYRVIASDSPIQHPGDGTVVGDFDATAAAGASETRTVAGGSAYYAVLYQDDAGNWGHLRSAGPVLVGYPRPKSATPVWASLVVAYDPCSAGSSRHAPPLNSASCSPPAQSSSRLTVGTADANRIPANGGGYVRFNALLDDSTTPADEADVRLRLDVADVFRKPALTDYTGELTAAVSIRLTDRRNGPTQDESGTTDFELAFPAACGATAGTEGANCTADTTANVVVPGLVRGGARTIWGLGAVRVEDGGADEQSATRGDNQEFLRQGIFAP